MNRDKHDDTAAPGQKMKDIMELYGKEIFLSKSRLSAAVRDLYGRDVKLKNLLLNAVSYGVPIKLRGLRELDGPARESRVHQIADGFAHDFSLRREGVYSAVNCFLYAFGYDALSLPSGPAAPRADPPVQTPPPPPPTGHGALSASPIMGGMIHFSDYDWRVLDIQNGKALLLSEKIIEKKAYHASASDIIWADCDLRRYLNGAFYQSFGRDKSRIAETTVVTGNNPWYDTWGGDATNDKIFLLSIEEVIHYFGDSGQLRNRPKKDAWYVDDQYNAARVAADQTGTAWWWWLRSPGFFGFPAACVFGGGTLLVVGSYLGDISSVGGGVRPALWLCL